MKGHFQKIHNRGTLNNSRETSWETATLVLKEGIKTTSVPVLTMKPPAPALTTLLTHKTIESIVEGIMERQQQPEQKSSKQTCLACGQPKMVPLSTFFLISKALSGTSIVPQRFLMLTVMKD